MWKYAGDEPFIKSSVNGNLEILDSALKSVSALASPVNNPLHLGLCGESLGILARNTIEDRFFLLISFVRYFFSNFTREASFLALASSDLKSPLLS